MTPKVFFVFTLSFLTFLALPSFALASTYYVNPSGSDSTDGLAAEAAFKTIQKAIDIAGSGDTIVLSPGEYRQDVVSRRNGSQEAPITITGPSNAIVKGEGNDHVIEINHDYHTLSGFTIDGLYGSATKASNYRDILIFVHGKEVRNGVTGFKATNLTIQNARGECLRLRYFVTQSEISHNTIKNCGVGDFVFNDGGKNGEGVYLGTSSKQWGDGKNLTSDADETRDNHIHHNDINTQGNECVDIKEGATANIVEYNTCSGQKDPESGGFDSRGDTNVFRYNSIKDSVGAGIRLGGWLVKNIQYGKNNDVYDNVIENNKGGGIRFQIIPQGKVCGNQFSNNGGGNSVGNYVSKFNPANPCVENTTPTPTPSPSPTPTPTSTLAPSSSSGGGGGSGGSSFVPSMLASANSFLPSNFDSLALQQKIAVLTGKVTELRTQINNLLSQSGQLSVSTSSCSFTRDLYLGLVGEDVRCLQKYLNSTGFLVASAGPGSLGNETLYFGPLTKQAVVAWQNAKASTVLVPFRLTSGTGYWGPISISHYKNNL